MMVGYAQLDENLILVFSISNSWYTFRPTIGIKAKQAKQSYNLIN